MGKTPDTVYSLQPTVSLLVDLPIDHFRLLGVSPTAEAEMVLRTLQLRLDRTPDQGFTHDALTQRAELLRLSADLLSDPVRRREYEATLLELGRDHPGETAGLELASNREVAGLMLLWEAHAPHETFQMARQALQPPQAPALGSGRESDLSLLAALACRDAAFQDSEQRRYESAANLLQEGLQLLQRMGKLPDQRQALESELRQLRPYRILDLLSRDLAEQSARREGLVMLEAFILERGGLEGAPADAEASDEVAGAMDQGAFELFFQQIRRFLTVQEQVDLFGHLQEAGSIDAAFLGVMALAAAGFSQRKPERVQDARTKLEALVLDGFDTKPLLGCLDLLLGDVDRAERRFSTSADPALKAWMDDHPGDVLAALCDYCRTWLGRDVLPGYRDMDADAVDLETWFADRDVQAYVESLERKQARQATFTPPMADDLPPLGLDPDGTLPMSIPAPAMADESSESEADVSERSAAHPFSWPRIQQLSWPALPRLSVPEIPRPSRPVLIGSGVFAALVVVVAVGSLIGLRQEADPSAADGQSSAVKEKPLPQANATPPTATLKPEQTASGSAEPAALAPLKAPQPTAAQLQRLLQGWLDGKAAVLQGEGTAQSRLQAIARPGLISLVRQQRAADQAGGLKQAIEASITSVQLVSETPQRIELLAEVDYRDQTTNTAGRVVAKTEPSMIRVTYILGRDADGWRLQAYIPG